MVRLEILTLLMLNGNNLLKNSSIFILRLSASVVKNIYCNDAIFRDVVSASIDDANDITIRRQGVKIFGLVVEKLREIFSMNAFKNSKPVLSAMTGKLPDLKVVAEFWKFEVEALNKLDVLVKDSFCRQAFKLCV